MVWWTEQPTSRASCVHCSLLRFAPPCVVLGPHPRELLSFDPGTGSLPSLDRRQLPQPGPARRSVSRLPEWALSLNLRHRFHGFSPAGPPNGQETASWIRDRTRNAATAHQALTSGKKSNRQTDSSRIPCIAPITLRSRTRVRTCEVFRSSGEESSSNTGQSTLRIRVRFGLLESRTTVTTEPVIRRAGAPASGTRDLGHRFCSLRC